MRILRSQTALQSKNKNKNEKNDKNASNKRKASAPAMSEASVESVDDSHSVPSSNSPCGSLDNTKASCISGTSCSPPLAPVTPAQINEKAMPSVRRSSRSASKQASRSILEASTSGSRGRCRRRKLEETFVDAKAVHFSEEVKDADEAGPPSLPPTNAIEEVSPDLFRENCFREGRGRRRVCTRGRTRGRGLGRSRSIAVAGKTDEEDAIAMGTVDGIEGEGTQGAFDHGMASTSGQSRLAAIAIKTDEEDAMPMNTVYCNKDENTHGYEDTALGNGITSKFGHVNCTYGRETMAILPDLNAPMHDYGCHLTASVVYGKRKTENVNSDMKGKEKVHISDSNWMEKGKITPDSEDMPEDDGLFVDLKEDTGTPTSLVIDLTEELGMASVRRQETGSSSMPQQDGDERTRDLLSTSFKGSGPSRSRSRFLEIARRRAHHFAHFPSDGNVERDNGRTNDGARRRAQRTQRGDQHLQQAELEQQQDQADWPGPFSTARQLVQNRAKVIEARKRRTLDGYKDSSIIEWLPNNLNSALPHRKSCPSLYDLCLDVLARHSEDIVSVEGVPDFIRSKICAAACAHQKVDTKMLSLFLQGEPSEIVVPDCTLIDDSDMTKLLNQFSFSSLEMLHLGFCGRAMTDQCLLTSIAKPHNVIPLKSVSLHGAYRLTDMGLKGLLRCTSQLVHLDLSECSFLSDAAIDVIVSCCSDTLKSLILNRCINLNGSKIARNLVRLSKLKKLSLSGIKSLTNEDIGQIVAEIGPSLKELVLAECCSLISESMSVIAACCPNLEALDMSHLPLLTDLALAYIADSLRNLKKLNLKRCKFSDEALASFITASGSSLTILSVNSVRQVADHTILALVKHCSATLQQVDMSFCRLLRDESLGCLVDSCYNLTQLKLFGCTQVTDKFLKGHRNPNLTIIGM